MTHGWQIEEKEYMAMPLHKRMFVDMLSEMAEVRFADKVIDTIVKRYPTETHCWDYEDSDKEKINYMKTIVEAGMNAYCAILTLYESEYGKMSRETEKILNESADIIAEQLLVVRGYKK